MKISISGLDEAYRRTVELLVDLFYEDANYSYEARDQERLAIKNGEQPEYEEDEAGGFLQLTFHYPTLTNAKEQCHLTIRDGYTQEEAIYTQHLEADLPLKRAIQRVVLQAFEEWTGIKQAWGILTGIRPTKLYYQNRHQDKTKKQIKTELQTEYQVSTSKIDLMERITERQLTVLPDLHHLQDEVSLYIGIPFCPTKCAYCTFPAYDIQGLQGSVYDFLTGLHYEMEQIGRWLAENNKKVTTIYYGGGTPTSIEAEQMNALYEHMYRVIPHIDQVREITVEAGRPDTITPAKLEVLKKHKIDRISINPQSYSNDTLIAIGRHHTVEETIEKYELARQFGFSNINMDLIIGLPNEGLKEFEHTLEQTERLMPESLTVHTLSFKRASKMTKNKQRYKVASRDEVVQMMHFAEKWTSEKGYNPYYLYRQKNILGNLRECWLLTTRTRKPV